MLTALARAEAVRSLADDTPAQALSVIARAARQVTTARRAAIVLIDPAVRRPSIVAAFDAEPGLPPGPDSAQQLLRIDTPGVRMVEIIAGTTTIGVLVLCDLDAWGLIAATTTDVVLDLADLAATAVILDRVYRSRGDTTGRIEGEIIDDPDSTIDLWWVVRNLERWRKRAAVKGDQHALDRLSERVDYLVGLAPARR